MKIAQICGEIEGVGVTRFIIEQNNAFKSCGHNITTYFCPNRNNNKLTKRQKQQNIDNIIEYDYSKSMLDEINSCDLVFINQLMLKTREEEYVKKYMNFLIDEIQGPKKIFFINSHKISGQDQYNREIWADPVFLNSVDYIATFNHTTPIYSKIKSIIGEEVAMKKFISMLLPYKFDENIEWCPLENKHKRITYIGRYATFKCPEMLLDVHKHLQGIYEFEMRGIDRSISTVGLPDLFYELDPDKKKSLKERILGPSKYTRQFNKTWMKENNTDEELMVDMKHDDKVWIFGPYDRRVGLKAINKSVFGAEFFHLKDHSFYGDDIEYAMMEIVEQGTVPLFNWHAGENIKLHENGKQTDKSFLDLNIGLYLKRDLSNIDEIISKLDELYHSKEKYDEYRKYNLEMMKIHHDYKSVVTEFLEQIDLKN